MFDIQAIAEGIATGDLTVDQMSYAAYIEEGRSWTLRVNEPRFPTLRLYYHSRLGTRRFGITFNKATLQSVGGEIEQTLTDQEYYLLLDAAAKRRDEQRKKHSEEVTNAIKARLKGNTKSNNLQVP